MHFPVAQALKIGSKEKVDRIPPDGPGKVTLQGGGKLDHVGQEYFGMLCWFGHREGIGQVEAEFLDVFQRLSRAIRAVDKP